MKRFLSTSFIILALVVSAAGAAPAAHAADCTVLDQACTPPGGGTGKCVNDDSGGLTCTSAIGTTYTVDPAAANTKTDYGDKSTDGIFASVMQGIMKLFAWLVGAAALTLDYSVYYTVVNMGNYVKDLAAVGVAWKILRDIGNIIIIFGFLGIGIATILDVNWYGGKTKMLPMLLVAAIFLNFSLFFAEAIVDTGNLFATQFYTQIKGGQLPTAASLSGMSILDAIEKEGISNKIMGQLGLQTIYTAGRVNPDVFKAGNSLLIGFMGIILFIATAFTLFSLAFVLIARFVRLLYLIILAPIGFAGLAVPQLKGMASKWWKDLFDQTITAPVLFLLLYIALAVITDAQFLTGLGVGTGRTDSDWTGWVTNNNLAGFGGVMLSFLVAIGVLLYVVVASKQLSAFGADWAAKTAGKLSFGLTAAGMRSTAGWGAQALSRRFSSSKYARIPVLGRSVAGVLDRGAKGSFDVRGIKTLGGLKSGIGIDAGEAQKGGYKEALKKGIESRTKYAGELKGKDFKDLSAEKKFELANLEKELETEKKDLKSAKTPEEYKNISGKIEKAEKSIEEFHKKEGTERGNKFKYANTLSRLVLASNTEAAKKIKEEAKKSKDDKELDALRKALKKAGDEEGGGGGAPGGGAPGGGGGAPGGGAPGGGGGAPGGGAPNT